MFYGLAKVYHVISTPGMCPSYSGSGGRGVGVVFVGGVEEMHFPLNFYSE